MSGQLRAQPSRDRVALVALVVALPSELDPRTNVAGVLAMQHCLDGDEAEPPSPHSEELNESGTDEIDGIAIPLIHLHDSPPTHYAPRHHVANVPSDAWTTGTINARSARTATRRPGDHSPAIRSLLVFVSDLRHFLDMPDDVPAPARRLAEHLTLIVRAATAGDAGLGWVSALPCRRRPGRRACPGHFAVLRTDVPPSIECAVAF